MFTDVCINYYCCQDLKAGGGGGTWPLGGDFPAPPHETCPVIRTLELVPRVSAIEGFHCNNTQKDSQKLLTTIITGYLSNKLQLLQGSFFLLHMELEAAIVIYALHAHTHTHTHTQALINGTHHN